MTSENQPQAGDILIVSPVRRTHYKKDRPVRHFIEKRIYKPLFTKISNCDCASSLDCKHGIKDHQDEAAERSISPIASVSHNQTEVPR